MSGTQLIQVILILPLLALLGTFLFTRRENLRESVSIGVGIVLFLVVYNLAQGVFSGERPELTVSSPIPGPIGEAFTIAFRVEPLGALFALIASGLWIATTCYAIGYMRSHHEAHQTRFYACFAAAIFAAMGAAMAKNLFTLFVFYEVMTLSTYPLVTHHGTAEAKQGGRVYLGILLTTSISFFMFAIVWTWSIAGTLDFQQGGILAASWEAGEVSTNQLAILLGLFAFGTAKAALMPFHRWLPSAMVAPTPVSALLHAVAVVKVGVFTIMKVAVYVFGVDLLHETGASEWLMMVAATTILLASLVAMTKDNLKARLAYSTISQLSYIILGAALANRWGVLGGSLHIAMHAVGKITLFFCAGAIYVATHKKNISEMDGIGRRMPLTMLAFLLGSLSIIGLPPFGGSWSKWFLAMGAAHTDYPWLMAVLMISSLLNVAYLLPIPIRAFYFPSNDNEHPGTISEAPMFCVLPLCATAVGGIILFLFADRIYAVLEPLTRIAA